MVEKTDPKEDKTIDEPITPTDANEVVVDEEEVIIDEEATSKTDSSSETKAQDDNTKKDMDPEDTKDATNSEVGDIDAEVDNFIKEIIDESPSEEQHSEAPETKPEDNTKSKSPTQENTVEESETLKVEIDDLPKDTLESDNSSSVVSENSSNSPTSDTTTISETEEIIEAASPIVGHTQNENVHAGDSQGSANSSVEGYAEVTTTERIDASPITTGASDPTQNGIAAESQTISTKKKSKAPIIIFLCLLLCAIGGLATWLILRSTPEAQVTDAISGLLTARQLNTTGSINVKFDQAANPDIRSVRLDIGATSAHIPATASATLSITTQANTTFKLDLGETISRDGTIYLKISGLRKAINSAKVPNEIQSYLNYFTGVISKADDQWWMIAIPDLLDQLGSSLNQGTNTKDYANAYQCILDKVADDDGSELANLYKQHPFVDVANYTGTQLQPIDNGTIFSISINRPKLSSFQADLKNTEYQKSLKKCVAQISASEDTSTSSQVDATFDTLSKFPPAYIEVSGFDHHLSRFYYDYKVDDLASFNIDLRFSFPNTVSVDIPNDARAITELVDGIVDGYTNMIYDIYDIPYYTNCTSLDEYVNCVNLY